MKIIIGTDHAGVDLKNTIAETLRSQGHEVEDKGCHTNDSIDYPDYAQAVCEAVHSNEGSLGILICGTGIGMSIAANKVKGIRAALCRSEFEAQMCRNHNNANVLCLGARILSTEEAQNLVQVYLTSEFEGGRHGRRVDKMMALES